MVAKKTTKKKTTKPVPRKRASSRSNGEAIEEMALNQLQQRLDVINSLVGNAVLGRTNFLESIEGTKRDIDAECGYPTTTDLNTVEKYYRPFYERHPIATRVVQLYPDECWKVFPEVFETEDPEEVTSFEEAWDQMSMGLLGESKYKRDEGNPIWECFRRADILSGIGHYGVIFLGLDDGQRDLSQPAQRREGQRLLFLRVFDQADADITSYETDPTNPRFGLPTKYSIEFSSPENTGGIGVTSVVHNVHYSRVIHIADNVGSNEVFGTPRMRPVFNRLWDMRKLYGGSAEMFWKGAFFGLAAETHPQLGGEVDVNPTKLREEMQNYMEGLQRFLLLKGMSAKSLAPQVADPTAHIETQLDAVCIQLGCPKRIFMGSERGELASSQDKITWNERVMARQTGYISPRIIVRFVDHLIGLGVLPEPDEYSIRWPDLENQTRDEKATVAVKQTEALAKYVAGDVQMIMPPLEYYTIILDMDKDQAQSILESAEEEAEEREEELGEGLEQGEQGRDGTTQGRGNGQDEGSFGEVPDEEAVSSST